MSSKILLILSVVLSFFLINCKQTIPGSADNQSKTQASNLFKKATLDDKNSGEIQNVQIPITPENILQGYRAGFFLWQSFKAGTPIITWFNPPHRAVLDFDKYKTPKNIRKPLKEKRILDTRLGHSATYKPLRISINEAFSDVINHCWKIKRLGQTGSWITQEVVDEFIKLNQQGYAISVEVWITNDDGTEDLIGGTYGILNDGVYNAESMFRYVDDASKIAVDTLIGFLKTKSVTWMDVQEISDANSYAGKKGAYYISRKEYLKRLQDAHQKVCGQQLE